MSIFAKATPAPQPKTKNIRAVSLLLAGILTAMVVAQLFTFEKFPDVIVDMWLPGGDSFAPLWAALIVTLEVGALPFLLSLRLSKAMRVTSMVTGWLVVVLWLAVSIWQNITSSVIANAGILGATIPLPIGWWSVLLSVSLAVLAAWAAWGMWPFGQNKAAKKK